jgi:hypothetical protein
MIAADELFCGTFYGAGTKYSSKVHHNACRHLKDVLFGFARRVEA